MWQKGVHINFCEVFYIIIYQYTIDLSDCSIRRQYSRMHGLLALIWRKTCSHDTRYALLVYNGCSLVLLYSQPNFKSQLIAA